MKKYVLLLGLLIQTVSLCAQEASIGKSMFSIHSGPSWYLGKMIGIIFPRYQEGPGIWEK